MANSYTFKYLPLEGKLSGKSFEKQTEDAINDLGNRIVNAETDVSTVTEQVQTAYDTATEAQNTADTALSAANNAQTAANNAQTTATNAEATAQSALTAASQATDATSTKANIYHASDMTDYGIGSADLYGHVKLSDGTTNAEMTADSGTAATPYAVSVVQSELSELTSTVSELGTTADTLSTSVSALSESLDSTVSDIRDDLSTTADTLNTAFETLTESVNTTTSDIYKTLSGTVTASALLYAVMDTDTEYDLDEFFTEHSRRQAGANVANTPDGSLTWFVDIDVNSEMTVARQIATQTDGSAVYVRWAAITATETTDETGAESANNVTYTATWSEWAAIGGAGGGSDINIAYDSSNENLIISTTTVDDNIAGD